MGDALTRLAGQLRGELLQPNDHGYDDARRGYNSLHDHRPAVIVRPVDGDDIARALQFASSAGLEIAVRSGGHSLAGYGATDGGVLIDLSAMHAIRIDPAARVAWVEAGASGRLTATTAAHGLVVPFGDSPTVGVGGITLGGGVGWLSRKLGLRGVIDLADAAPDELTTISLITRLPPLSIVPPEADGQLAVLITLVWCGELQAGERVVDTFRALAPPIADLLHPRPYPSMYELIPEAPQWVTNITYSFAADELDDQAIGSILQQLEESNLPSTQALTAVELRVLGGAISRIPDDATALPTANGSCSAPSSRPGSPRLIPTVTPGGCGPCQTRSGISRRARTSTSSTPRTNLASTRPTRTAPIVVSSRSSGTTTRRTSCTATSTSDPPRRTLGCRS